MLESVDDKRLNSIKKRKEVSCFQRKSTPVKGIHMPYSNMPSDLFYVLLGERMYGAGCELKNKVQLGEMELALVLVLVLR